jgi:8-oxo-dGTP pyrophosphatase MutT (NUDIX family)
METKFNIFYWGANTEVQFQPFTEVPKDIPVTSCMVMATINNEYMVLSSPQRGWGLPGGHTEEGETPEETAIRELREEAAVEIDKKSLKVVGGWLAKKINKTEKNAKYPDLAYMLLFTADIKKINQFTKRFEIYDRIFVPINKVTNYAGGVNFIQIFNHITETYKDRFIKRDHEDKVSIVIPFHNTGKYIEKCLDSVAKQSYKNIEVILVNDGSTDNSEDICESYVKSDNRFSLVKLKKNMGPAVARNTGLDFVTGNYICLIDSDDYIHEDFVSKLLSTATQSNADIVECQNYCSIDGKLTDKHSADEYATETTVSSGKEVLRNYLRHSKPRTSTVTLCHKIYKTDLFKNNHISFDPNLVRFEDSDIMYKLYEKAEKQMMGTMTRYM